MNTVVSIHPQAVEAKKRAAARQQQREIIKKAIATHGVHFHTVGDYTFCYRVDRRNVLELSSTIRHPNDKHDPTTAKHEALKRFMSNNRMLLKTPSHTPVRAFLDFTFSGELIHVL